MQRWCSQPYIREEALDIEISKLLAPFALRDDWAKEMLAQLNNEERQSKGGSTALLAHNRNEIDAIRAKLERLTELRLDNEIDAKAFSSRKANLLSRKKTLEEDSLQIGKGNQPWLEPLQNWILTARNLAKIIELGTLFEKRGAAEKVFGSNLFLDLKRARGKAVKPWAFLDDNEFNRQRVGHSGLVLGGVRYHKGYLAILRLWNLGVSVGLGL
jgi:hypothetical protein